MRNSHTPHRGSGAERGAEAREVRQRLAAAAESKDEPKPTTGRKRERRGKAPGGDTLRRQMRARLKGAPLGTSLQVRLEPPESKEDRETRYAMNAAKRRHRRLAAEGLDSPAVGGDA